MWVNAEQSFRRLAHTDIIMQLQVGQMLRTLRWQIWRMLQTCEVNFVIFNDSSDIASTWSSWRIGSDLFPWRRDSLCEYIRLWTTPQITNFVQRVVTEYFRAITSLEKWRAWASEYFRTDLAMRECGKMINCTGKLFSWERWMPSERVCRCLKMACAYLQGSLTAALIGIQLRPLAEGSKLMQFYVIDIMSQPSFLETH